MTSPVLYHTSDFPAWIDVALQLQEQLAWRPVYWVAPDYREARSGASFRELAEQSFPDLTYHDPQKMHRCIPAAGFEGAQAVGSLARSSLEKYREYAPTVFRMMDRQDLDGSFNHLQRRRFFNRCLIYWSQVFERESLSAVIFHVAPHFPASYLLYAVAREEGVKVVIPTPTPVGNLIHFRASVDEPSKNLRVLYRDLAADDDAYSKLSESTQEHLTHLRQASDTWKPSFMEEQREVGKRAVRPKVIDGLRPTKWKEYASSIFRKGKRWLDPAPMSYWIGNGEPPEESWPSGWEIEYEDFRANQKKAELRREYLARCELPVLEDPFVYVPLHYQPERTTCPEGGVFVDQELVVRILDGALPEGWSIYVKEHPSQFSISLDGHKGRQETLYDDLLQLSSVRLVPHTVPSLQLIDSGRAVATVTGSAGWEAVVRGTPALAFGKPWYSVCSEVFQVSSLQECSEKLRRIEEGVTPNPERIHEFLARLEKLSAQAALTRSAASSLSMSEKTIAENLAGKISAFVQEDSDMDHFI